MNKRIILSISLLFAVYSFGFGQEKFTFNIDGLNPRYIVVEIDSLKQAELFKNSINWIKETYKNPDKVIKTTFDNEKVRFEGSKDNLICVYSIGFVFCYTGMYTIEIEFKDNKYKFRPISVEYRLPADKYSASRMAQVDLIDGSLYYNNKGVVRKMYETWPTSIETLFNELNSSLSKYLLMPNEDTEKNDW